MTGLEKGDGGEERWERECRSVRSREGEKQRKRVEEVGEGGGKGWGGDT